MFSHGFDYVLSLTGCFQPRDCCKEKDEKELIQNRRQEKKNRTFKTIQENEEEKISGVCYYRVVSLVLVYAWLFSDCKGFQNICVSVCLINEWVNLNTEMTNCFYYNEMF